MRKILSPYLHSPGDDGGDDLLEVFVQQLPNAKPPGFDGFFRRFKVEDVKTRLADILKGASSLSAHTPKVTPTAGVSRVIDKKAIREVSVY